MIRPEMTYRAERRNNWRTLNGVTWQEHNDRPQSDPWHIGSMQDNRVTMRRRSRSKYLPHESVKRGGSGPVFA
jgi:hypothetical protein